MTPKFVFIDHKTKETFVATDIKAISRKTGIPYENLVYRLRNSDLCIIDNNFSLSRVTESLNSLRSPSKFKKTKSSLNYIKQ